MLIRSFQATAALTSTELAFRADDDDQDSVQAIGGSAIVRVGPRLQGYASLPVFFQELVAATTGDLILCGNDDMVFRSQGWDALYLEEANRHPDGLFDLGCVTHNASVLPFSVISRWAVRQLGGVHPVDIYWGDVFLRDLMVSAGGYVGILSTVRIDHEWAGHDPDPTFLEAHQEEARHWDETYWALHQRRVVEGAAALRQAVAS